MMYYTLPTSYNRGKVKGTCRCREEEALLHDVKLISATNRHRQRGFPLVITKNRSNNLSKGQNRELMFTLLGPALKHKIYNRGRSEYHFLLW